MTPNPATEKMCDAVRYFIMGRDRNICTWAGMKEHLDECGSRIHPRIEEYARNYPKAFITKWDVAEIIYDLMEEERCK